jgi:hypothetical protein
MKLVSKLSFYVLPVFFAVLAAPTRAANVIPNGNFNTVGSYGNPVSVPAPGSVESAAANWITFLCDPGSTGTSALVASTDPSGGGLMMQFTTNGGFYQSCGNGLFTNLTSGLPLDSTGSFDINVAPGTSGEIGFVNSGGAFDSGSYLFSSTAGSWITASFTNLDSVTGEVGFEIFDSAGGTIYLDNGVAPTPEPGTISLVLCGALGLLSKTRLRKKCAARRS